MVNVCERVSCSVQDQYGKAMAALQQRLEDLETKLKALRLVLQEKVQQLKEQVSPRRPHGVFFSLCFIYVVTVKLWFHTQLVKNAKWSALLKDMYVENSELMKALQVTEQRQKHAEKKSSLLEEKVAALQTLLREVVAASLAT